MLKNVKSHFRFAIDKRITTIAGAWVYYFLSAIIPLAFLLITAYGVFGVDVSTQIVARLPIEFRDIAYKIVTTAKMGYKGVTIIFVFSVFFSASALIRQMLFDGGYIYDCKRKNKYFLRVSKGVVAIIVLFAVFLLSALLLVFGEYLLNTFSDRKIKNFFIFLCSVVFTIICFVVIFLLNVVICPIKIKKTVLLCNSMLSLILIFLSSIAMKIYLIISSRFNAFYGSLASVFGFLVWIYACMFSLCIGVVFSAFYSNKINKDN